jgi:hypothetical protein
MAMGKSYTPFGRYGISVLLIAGMWSPMRAQTVTGYRYWYDDDAANATTVSVAGGADYTLTASLEATALAPGYHRVTMQMQDSNGDYSVPLTSLFVQRGNTIAGYRYWFDDDAANATDVNVTGTADYTLSASLEATVLENGYHRVTMQLRDGTGEYGSPLTSTFVQRGVTVDGYEYWIDDDIAARTSGSIGPAGVVDLVVSLPTNTTAGQHLFTIRFSEEQDGWSVPLTSEFSFITGLDELPGLSDLLLFPNPTNGQLALRLTSADGAQLRLSVVDATGRVVRAEENWTPTGTAVRTWDLADLAPGSYSLRIANGDRQSTLRFQKN